MAHVRKGRGAIGAYGPEKAAKIAEPIEAQEEKKSAKTPHWRKANSQKKSYTYKSVDQLLEDSKSRPPRPGFSSSISKVKVIDCRGPEQKVLSGYHAIANSQQRPEEAVIHVGKKTTVNFALPELQHNLNILVDMCEQDIIQNDKRMRFLNDRLITVENEEKNVQKAKTQHEQIMKRTEFVLSTVERIMDEANTMSLSQMAVEFKNFKDNYSEEYKEFELGDLASTLVSGRVKAHLASWNPLAQPTYPLELFKIWKDVLEGRVATLHGVQPYDQLVWNTWMPFLRGAVQEWNCRHPEPLIVLIEEWMPLLPSWILDNILELVVLPKLTLEVEEWNSTEDTVPIHTWIHPWLALLGNRLNTQVYPIIRRKLGSALTRWHPADRTARRMIECWNKVFSEGEMQAFLLKNIVPKLIESLFQLEINPGHQDMEMWNRVYEWRHLLSAHVMADILDKHFFPKWMHRLMQWLNHSPNFDEVSRWYMGWKSVLDAKLLAEPVVKEHFRKALEIMNRAVDGSSQPVPQPMDQGNYHPMLERSQAPPPQSRLENIDELVGLVGFSSQIPQGFKDIVQNACEKRGILFMPMPNRYKEGKPVYKIGKQQAYFEGDLIVVSNRANSWFPTNHSGLPSLLDFVEE